MTCSAFWKSCLEDSWAPSVALKTVKCRGLRGSGAGQNKDTGAVSSPLQASHKKTRRAASDPLQASCRKTQELYQILSRERYEKLHQIPSKHLIKGTALLEGPSTGCMKDFLHDSLPSGCTVQEQGTNDKYLPSKVQQCLSWATILRSQGLHQAAQRSKSHPSTGHQDAVVWHQNVSRAIAVSTQPLHGRMRTRHQQWQRQWTARSKSRKNHNLCPTRCNSKP